MKLITILAFTLLPALFRSDVPPGDVMGKYEYKVNVEFVEPYRSTLWIKNHNRYEREVFSHGLRKTAGAWEIKGDSLWLTPDKKYKLEPFGMLIGKGYLLIGQVGMHEKEE